MSAIRYAAVAGGAVVGFLAGGPAGAMVGGALGLLVTGGSAPKPSDGSPAAPTGTDTTPTPAGRTRVIDSSTAYPMSFASKYAGSAAKWKELLGSDSSLSLVYLHWDPESDAEVGWFKDPPSYIPPGKAQQEGLSPWIVGQTVTIPEGWPG